MKDFIYNENHNRYEWGNKFFSIWFIPMEKRITISCFDDRSKKFIEKVLKIKLKSQGGVFRKYHTDFIPTVENLRNSMSHLQRLNSYA